MRRWLKTKIRKRVVVYTVDDVVLDGWLFEVADDGIVLNDTQVRSDSDIALVGDVFVPREKIRMVQVTRAVGR